MDAGPNFLIIGAMKSGTSSLFSWLGEQPEIALPTVKEPNFFSDDANWQKGWPWYAELFRQDGRLTGEASVAYTHPDRAAIAAKRIAELLPDALLIFVMRHPIERVASEYRHQVQRGREGRPFAQATSDPATKYAARSRYFTSLSPYLERFPRSQLLLIRTEDLPGSGWREVLSHLGLAMRAAPVTAHNVTETKRGFSPLMRMLFDRNLTTTLAKLPAPVRRIGRRVLFRTDERYNELFSTSREALAPKTADSIWGDVERLEAWLGSGRLWER